MAVYKRSGSKYWWFKFPWNGEPIRESTKQTNKRIAEQMEASRRTQLAKNEVGIRDRLPVPTLGAFADERFLPFVRLKSQASLAPSPSTRGERSAVAKPRVGVMFVAMIQASAAKSMPSKVKFDAERCFERSTTCG